MPEYEIKLKGLAQLDLRAHVVVTADTRAEAEALAFARAEAGKVDWVCETPNFVPSPGLTGSDLEMYWVVRPQNKQVVSA